MTTTDKTNAELRRDADIQNGVALLNLERDTRRWVEQALRINDPRDGHIADVYDLGPSDAVRYGTGPHSYVAEIEGGPLGREYGTTYRIVVDGAEPESRAYLTLDHAILALVAHRAGNGSTSYDVATFAARAFGVNTLRS